MKQAYATIFDPTAAADGTFIFSITLTCYNIDGTSQQLTKRRLQEVFPSGVLGIKFTADVEVNQDSVVDLLTTISNAVEGGYVTSTTTFFCGCPYLVLPLKVRP